MSTILYLHIKALTSKKGWKLVKWRQIVVFFPLFLYYSGINAQQISTPLSKYSGTELETLFNSCRQSREDTVNRLLLGFSGKYSLRKNATAFFTFCDGFKKICTQHGEQKLYRRLQVLELQNKLRIDNATDDKANSDFEKLHYTFIDDGDYPAALECLFELGLFLHRKKKDLRAIKVLFYAEKFAEKHQLQHKISYQGVLHYTGYILWHLDKPGLSVDYFKKSLATGFVIPADSMVALNGLGMNYQKMDSLPQSLHYFNEASRVALSAKNEVFNTVVLGSAAVTLLQMGEADRAYLYCMQYKNLCVQLPIRDNIVDGFYRLIQIELKRGNTAHAKVLLDSLSDMMPQINDTDFISMKRQKEVAWQYYEKMKQFDKALAAYKEYVHYDSLFQDYASKSKISELELNAEVRLYEQEMADKERARKLSALLETGIILTVLLAVTLLVVWGYKKIKRAQKQRLEAESVNWHQAAEIEMLKQQLLDQLAAMRNDNMHFQAMTAQNAGNTPRTEDDESLTVDNENEADRTMGKPADSQLLRDYNLAQKEQWEGFKASFNKIYPGFEQHIIHKIGPVSGAELRLMMLHKLGLNNKEIAQTLLISADGVKKSKYRLYKRIGINSSAELSEFLQNCV